MPIVRIEMLEGKSKEYKKTLLDGIHQALVDSIKMPDSDRKQCLHELDNEHFDVVQDNKDSFILIEIKMFKGRSSEAKKALYKAIVDNLNKSLGLNKNDILITILDPPLENWGVGGIPVSEVNLSYKIEV